MIVSAHDLCTTRLCQAADCENDAETGWALCANCERRRLRGVLITLHNAPQHAPLTLRCSVCRNHKIDDDFAHSSTSQQHRRGRSSECRACRKKRQRPAKHKAGA